jgi:hypothetical protein
VNVGRETGVAFLAIKHAAEAARAPLTCCHPRPVRPRRLMPDVLMVSTLELGYPVLLGILVIADDAFFHTDPYYA